jgi:hypothetical protein
MAAMSSLYSYSPLQKIPILVSSGIVEQALKIEAVGCSKGYQKLLAIFVEEFAKNSAIYIDLNMTNELRNSVQTLCNNL